VPPELYSLLPCKLPPGVSLASFELSCFFATAPCLRLILFSSFFTTGGYPAYSKYAAALGASSSGSSSYFPTTHPRFQLSHLMQGAAQPRMNGIAGGVGMGSDYLNGTRMHQDANMGYGSNYNGAFGATAPGGYEQTLARLQHLQEQYHAQQSHEYAAHLYAQQRQLTGNTQRSIEQQMAQLNQNIASENQEVSYESDNEEPTSEDERNYEKESAVSGGFVLCSAHNASFQSASVGILNASKTNTSLQRA
jgi:hypothetical protein